MDAPPLPTLDTFARRPRDALMWLPRAVDVSRIAAACRVAGPRVVDVGAGTGLLARLLEAAGVKVMAFDPSPPPVAHHDVMRKAAHEIIGEADCALVSWMEAGQDYRVPVAWLAPVIVNVYDVEGGCGVMGAVDFAPYAYKEVVSWRTPSFEDAEFALDRRGRGIQRKGYPGNRVDVLTRAPALADRLRRAVQDAPPLRPYPWEREMDEVGL